MSRNIESLRAAFAAFNDGDFERLRGLAAPDVELYPVIGEPRRGIDSFVDFFEPDAFDRQQIDPLEFKENGDRVFVSVEFTASGAGSGIELSQTTYVVYRFADGLASRMEVFTERDGALRAAGFEPSD